MPSLKQCALQPHFRLLESLSTWGLRAIAHFCCWRKNSPEQEIWKCSRGNKKKMLYFLYCAFNVCTTKGHLLSVQSFFSTLQSKLKESKNKMKKTEHSIYAYCNE